MKYDLFADFYEKSSDNQPVYIVLLGTINTCGFSDIEKFGFHEDEDSTPGYLDYVMDVDKQSVSEWVQDGYAGELMDVLDARSEWSRIQIRAMEVEIIDDEGHYPPRGLMICETFVRFEYSDLDQPVYFEDTTNPDLRFSLPMLCLKRYFKVKTMMEVMDGLNHFGTGQHWSLEQLRRYFASGIDEAVEIAAQVFKGERDLDGNSALLHALSVGMAGKNDDEKIVGFLHDVVEDSSWEIDDLKMEGFSEEVISAVSFLTHDKVNQTYDEYIDRIINSGNELAINVKVNDLYHNIERGKKGKHHSLVKKHELALAKIKESVGVK